MVFQVSFLTNNSRQITNYLENCSPEIERRTNSKIRVRESATIMCYEINDVMMAKVHGDSGAVGDGETRLPPWNEGLQRKHGGGDS